MRKRIGIYRATEEARQLIPSLLENPEFEIGAIVDPDAESIRQQFDAIDPGIAHVLDECMTANLDALILDAHKLVKPGGRLIFVQSSMADFPRSLEYMREHGMNVRVVGETDGPFRDYYFEDEAYLRELASIPGSYDVRDGQHYERLMVFEARLP